MSANCIRCDNGRKLSPGCECDVCGRRSRHPMLPVWDSDWLDALEREIASKEKHAREVEMNVGKTSSIHEADYARGVVDGLRVARSYGLAMTSASNNEVSDAAH